MGKKEKKKIHCGFLRQSGLLEQPPQLNSSQLPLADRLPSDFPGLVIAVFARCVEGEAGAGEATAGEADRVGTGDEAKDEESRDGVVAVEGEGGLVGNAKDEDSLFCCFA